MRKLTTEEWIQKAKAIHGDRYDYSKTEYVNKDIPVEIICSEHGSFMQIPYVHLRGSGCPICGRFRIDKAHSLTTKQFIEKAKEIHGNKYDYSKVNYIKNTIPIIIICLEHGEFEQLPRVHLAGHGCPECGKIVRGQKRSVPINEQLDKCKEVHNNFYDYSLVPNDTKWRDKIKIICPIHGIFEQTLGNHLKGTGCPKCNQSKGEKEIEQFLLKNNIEFISQYEIDIDTSINQTGIARIDFYIPFKNLFIEYNGQQHYISIKYFGGEITFNRQQKRDKYVRNYCEQNNIKLIEIPYTELNNIENILKENII